MTYDLATVRTNHRDAVAAFVATAHDVPAQLWNVPLAAGKWSPAQVAEHLRLSYLTLDAELSGGQGLRLRTTPLRRLVLRLVYLPGILRTGRVPRGAKAPREVRPGDGPFDRATTLAALEIAAAAFEVSLASRRDARAHALTHHVFGGLDAAKSWRFVTVHTEHHRRQIVDVGA